MYHASSSSCVCVCVCVCVCATFLCDASRDARAYCNENRPPLSPSLPVAQVLASSSTVSSFCRAVNRPAPRFFIPLDVINVSVRLSFPAILFRARYCINLFFERAHAPLVQARKGNRDTFALSLSFFRRERAFN